MKQIQLTRETVTNPPPNDVAELLLEKSKAQWDSTHGVYADLSDLSQPKFYSKCPKCGHVHGFYTNLADAVLKKICGACHLDDIEKLKRELEKGDKPPKVKPGQRKKLPWPLSAVKEAKEPERNIDWHLSEDGTVAYLDWIAVPRDERRQGRGTAAYQQWERSLPGSVKTVRLMAADAGDGPSDEFWKAMGFDYDYQGEDWESVDYEARQMMSKPRTEPRTLESEENINQHVATYAYTDGRMVRRVRRVPESEEEQKTDWSPDPHDPNAGIPLGSLPLYWVVRVTFNFPSGPMMFYGTEHGEHNLAYSPSVPIRLTKETAEEVADKINATYKAAVSPDAITVEVAPAEDQSQMFWQGRLWPQDFLESLRRPVVEAEGKEPEDKTDWSPDPKAEPIYTILGRLESLLLNRGFVHIRDDFRSIYELGQRGDKRYVRVEINDWENEKPRDQTKPLSGPSLHLYVEHEGRVVVDQMLNVDVAHDILHVFINWTREGKKPPPRPLKAKRVVEEALSDENVDWSPDPEAEQVDLANIELDETVLREAGFKLVKKSSSWSHTYYTRYKRGYDYQADTVLFDKQREGFIGQTLRRFYDVNAGPGEERLFEEFFKSNSPYDHGRETRNRSLLFDPVKEGEVGHGQHLFKTARETIAWIDSRWPEGWPRQVRESEEKGVDWSPDPEAEQLLLRKNWFVPQSYKQIERDEYLGSDVLDTYSKDVGPRYSISLSPRKSRPATIVVLYGRGAGEWLHLDLVEVPNRNLEEYLRRVEDVLQRDKRTLRDTLNRDVRSPGLGYHILSDVATSDLLEDKATRLAEAMLGEENIDWSLDPEAENPFGTVPSLMVFLDEAGFESRGDIVRVKDYPMRVMIEGVDAQAKVYVSVLLYDASTVRYLTSLCYHKESSELDSSSEMTIHSIRLNERPVDALKFIKHADRILKAAGRITFKSNHELFRRLNTSLSNVLHESEDLQETVTNTPDEIAKEAAKVEKPKSDEHAEAGNYQKGHVQIQGLEITIENAKGSTRSGVGKDGQPWSVTMPAHYGYVAKVGGETGPRGKDKDHIDVYLGDKPSGLMVYVINQCKIDSDAFDEHKCFIGFESKDDAVDHYHRAFNGDLGRRLCRSVVSVTMDKFKDWLKSGDTKKPFESVTEAAVNLVDSLLENGENIDWSSDPEAEALGGVVADFRPVLQQNGFTKWRDTEHPLAGSEPRECWEKRYPADFPKEKPGFENTAVDEVRVVVVWKQKHALSFERIIVSAQVWFNGQYRQTAFNYAYHEDVEGAVWFINHADEMVAEAVQSVKSGDGFELNTKLGFVFSGEVRTHVFQRDLRDSEKWRLEEAEEPENIDWTPDPEAEPIRYKNLRPRWGIASRTGAFLYADNDKAKGLLRFNTRKEAAAEALKLAVAYHNSTPEQVLELKLRWPYTPKLIPRHLTEAEPEAGDKTDWTPDPEAEPIRGKLIDRYQIEWLDLNDGAWYYTYPLSSVRSAMEWAFSSSVWNKAKYVELVNSETWERWRMSKDYEVVDIKGSEGTPRPIFSLDEPDGPKGYYSPPPKSEVRGEYPYPASDEQVQRYDESVEELDWTSDDPDDPLKAVNVDSKFVIVWKAEEEGDYFLQQADAHGVLWHPDFEKAVLFDTREAAEQFLQDRAKDGVLVLDGISVMPVMPVVESTEGSIDWSPDPEAEPLANIHYLELPPEMQQWTVPHPFDSSQWHKFSALDGFAEVDLLTSRHRGSTIMRVYATVPWRTRYKYGSDISMSHTAKGIKKGLTELNQMLAKLRHEWLPTMKLGAELYTLVEPLQSRDWWNYVMQAQEEEPLPGDFGEQTPESLGRWKQRVKRFHEMNRRPVAESEVDWSADPEAEPLPARNLHYLELPLEMQQWTPGSGDSSMSFSALDDLAEVDFQTNPRRQMTVVRIYLHEPWMARHLHGAMSMSHSPKAVEKGLTRLNKTLARLRREWLPTVKMGAELYALIEPLQNLDWMTFVERAQEREQLPDEFDQQTPESFARWKERIQQYKDERDTPAL